MKRLSIAKHKLAVATMVWNHKKQILLVKSYKRGWEFPGGYVDQGESLKMAAKREVKEETGINIKVTGIYGIEQDVEGSTVIVIFSGKAVSGELASSDESQDVGYFSISQAKKMITSDIFRERMMRCLNKKEYPFVNEI
ncbi:NUDIX hydrolase [Bacillus massilinigeriensis]|uniref:NUDIX hydrolase n=1 Tax=Bacillus massilionigeriensis TaxID=1805475 RepID=UPI001F440F3D|nr:NUDIX hydrolase [Bacillus massilionigeriensis]